MLVKQNSAKLTIITLNSPLLHCQVFLQKNIKNFWLGNHKESIITYKNVYMKCFTTSNMRIKVTYIIIFSVNLNRFSTYRPPRSGG